MTISDRIAVMNAGRIEQIGSPSEIYNRPATRFVADFIGEINLFEGAWQDGAFVSNGVRLPADGAGRIGATAIAIRPERMRLSDDAGAKAGAALAGTVQISTFVSGQMIYRVVLDNGKEVTVKEADTGAARPIGARVGLDWNPDDVVVLTD